MISDQTADDAFNFLCGHKIGDGMTRTVYDCNIRKDVVIKVENHDIRTHFQNLHEWMVWQRVCGTDYEKFFAPVLAISPNGRLLMMARTTPIEHARLPKSVPAFFTDLKPSNFGLYKGKFCAHDYGTHLLMENGMNKRVKKAEWRLNE